MELSFRKEQMSDEFTKYHLEGLPFNAVLHHIKEDNGDYHDHPFGFTTTVLYGSYKEEMYLKNPHGVWCSRFEWRHEGDTFFVDFDHIHKIVSTSKGGCYTIIRPLEFQQEPGFYKFKDGQAFYRQWNETEFKPYNI